MTSRPRVPYLKVPKKLVFAAIPLLALTLTGEGIARVSEWRAERKRAKRLEREEVHYSLELQTHDGVRVSGRPGTIQLLLDPVRFYRLRPDVGRAELRTNTLGLRGPETTREKPAGSFRIVLIGGSTAYGWGAPRQEDCPAALLQEALGGERKVEVLNAGVPSYTTAQEFTYLATELLDFDLDLVVSLTGYNNLNAAWSARTSGANELFPQLEGRLLQAESAPHALMGQFALGRSLKRKLSRALESSGEVPHPEAFPPEARRIFRRAIGGMGALVPERLLVALQPVYLAHDPAQRPPEEVAALERFLYAEPAKRHAYQVYMDSGLNAMREELRALAARGEGIRSLDLSACMKGEEPVFKDLCHFAREGNVVIAARLAAAIHEHPAWVRWKP